MRVTDKGQVTIPKAIREAAGVSPGSEVRFAFEQGRIVLTKLAGAGSGDQRARLRAAAAKARAGMAPEFRQMAADDILAFLRDDGASAPAPAKRAPRR